jgi:hypothetical protein
MIYPDGFLNDAQRPAPVLSLGSQLGKTVRPLIAQQQLKAVLEKLAALRIELVDEAYRLEQRGQVAAADVALSCAAKLDALSHD